MKKVYLLFLVCGVAPSLAWAARGDFTLVHKHGDTPTAQTIPEAFEIISGTQPPAVRMNRVDLGSKWHVPSHFRHWDSTVTPEKPVYEFDSRGESSKWELVFDGAPLHEFLLSPLVNSLGTVNLSAQNGMLAFILDGAHSAFNQDIEMAQRVASARSVSLLPIDTDSAVNFWVAEQQVENIQARAPLYILIRQGKIVKLHEGSLLTEDNLGEFLRAQ